MYDKAPAVLHELIDYVWQTGCFPSGSSVTINYGMTGIFTADWEGYSDEFEITTPKWSGRVDRFDETEGEWVGLRKIRPKLTAGQRIKLGKIMK